ncbi:MULTISPECIES: hypothetical protein [Flavobacterium]|uniref:Phosphatidate cytidylyltransferase n=1 Tax=Flavobacterium cupriresistens TaxID=2893885 RepID=A0ABU4RL36_9FLAO|nr:MULTISPECIES: hypothetical protein [unclassified Flavobacterium]MDX6192090.1 hypothetical protein [Flavobacterium sp. Fl-318]UFH41887.1 hypothetical protein LNP23_19010 [Flavobacterium sp. F-323]
MKNKTLQLTLVFVILLTFTSCEVIGDIFKAGMGFGIFLVVLIIALVVFIISKFLGGK